MTTVARNVAFNAARQVASDLEYGCAFTSKYYDAQAKGGFERYLFASNPENADVFFNEAARIHNIDAGKYSWLFNRKVAKIMRGRDRRQANIEALNAERARIADSLPFEQAIAYIENGYKLPCRFCLQPRDSESDTCSTCFNNARIQFQAYRERSARRYGFSLGR
jgi:hypothetical protein